LRARFNEAASADLKEARAFYGKGGREARKRFNAQVRAVVELLRRQPEAGTPKGGTLREYTLDVFPYSLIYVVEDDELVISVVRHHSRDPTFWHDRLGPER
jgi:plasmid stabilization system protein ParE